MSAPVSIRELLPCRVPLPFMPDRIDYKIGKGCCDEILFCNGLFVPCSNHCEEGFKCKKHHKKSSRYGTYEERYNAWEKHVPYCVAVNDKEVREKSYWVYLHAKQLDYLAINKEMNRWGIPLEFNSTQWRMPKPVRPKIVKGTSLDGQPVSL